MPQWKPAEALGRVRYADRIQISHPLPSDYLEALKEASRQFPQKELHVYGSAFSGSLEGLIGFEHVENLTVDLYEATSFDVLSGFTSLRRLGIGTTRSATPSVAFLSNCLSLEDVWLQGKGKGLDAVSSLDHLKVLRLQNLRAHSLEFLAGHPSIERLELLYSSARDFSSLATMEQLRRLWICRIRGLTGTDLTPLSDSPFDMLALNDAGGIEDLSALGGIDIRHLSLTNLPQLQTLGSLRHWPHLELLGIHNAHPSDDSLAEVAANPALSHLAIADKLPHSQLRAIQASFNGESLWYRGDYLWGSDRPEDIIVTRDKL
ncbi:MAG: hypothetical protein ABSB09_08320 [Acidimicrobiales bacterium]